MIARYEEQIQTGQVPYIPLEKFKQLSPEGQEAVSRLRDAIAQSNNYKREHEDQSWRCDREPFGRALWHIRLNTYSEARLLSSQSLALNELKAATVKGGKRAGFYELGSYLPLNHARMNWRYDGQRQALFFAPIGKGGLETIPKLDGATSDEGTSVFKFVAGGLRLGHYRAFANSHSVAPELVSWIDLMIGQWDRFRNSQAPHRSLMRFEATGRLKIPYSPFAIGFTANTGSGPDEFGFFAGTRFDLSRILAKIAPAVK